MAKKVKFRDRYILAEGYPWAMGTKDYKELCMERGPQCGSGRLTLKWPAKLWGNDLPRYRLVLERVRKSK